MLLEIAIEIRIWSLELKFYTSNEMEGESQAKGTNSTSILDKLRIVYWPGGAQQAPRGWPVAEAGSEEKMLRIRVPASVITVASNVRDDKYKERKIAI